MWEFRQAREYGCSHCENGVAGLSQSTLRAVFHCITQVYDSKIYARDMGGGSLTNNQKPFFVPNIRNVFSPQTQLSLDFSQFSLRVFFFFAVVSVIPLIYSHFIHSFSFVQWNLSNEHWQRDSAHLHPFDHAVKKAIIHTEFHVNRNYGMGWLIIEIND